jgi:hypothetical protein
MRQEVNEMEEHVIVDSSVAAIITAPLDAIDLPAWCFTLSDEEYQGCSPAHVARVPRRHVTAGAWRSMSK